MDPVNSYLDLMASLDRLHNKFTAEQEKIITWYAHQQAAAQAAVARATEVAELAGAEVAQARSLVERTDLEAHRLWLRIQGRSGKGSPASVPPDPAPTAGVAGTDADPTRLLNQVADRLEQARQARGQLRELPGWMSPLLVVFGVLGAAAGYAVAYGARQLALGIGGDIEAFAPVLRLIVTVLAPLLGLVPARSLADRAGGQLDGGRIGVVVLAGLLTVCALFGVFR